MWAVEGRLHWSGKFKWCSGRLVTNEITFRSVTTRTQRHAFVAEHSKSCLRLSDNTVPIDRLGLEVKL
jgi:hypothetical protein